MTNPAGLEHDDSGISLIDGPRSSATSRTTLAGGAVGDGTVRSSSSGIPSLLLNVRQPRVRTITNESLPQLPATSFSLLDLFNQNERICFGCVLEMLLSFSGKDRLENVPSLTIAVPNEEQFLRSQYDNEQCDLMSLIKVHEYLTKQQLP